MLNIGSHQIPLNGVTKSYAILAKRGAGKSYTGAVMAEEMYKNNIPFVVFDPIDVWFGLRVDKDGKNKGLPIVVFGLENADIQLTKDMGAKIAQEIVKNNISCVISTFGMPKNQQRQLITDFATELLKINKTPRHVFIEEAHEFVPQRVFGDAGKTFNAVSNLVVMGRNRGLGVTLINQRAATINKDVLTQVDTLLAFRNIAPQDRKALKEWVEFHAAEGDFDAFMKSLPSLPTGEGWIWSPEFLGIFERIKIRQRETFHPDREKLGAEFVMPQLEQTDVQLFIESFSRQTKPVNPKGEQQTRTAQPLDEDSSDGSLVRDKTTEIISLKNDYESKIISKDMTIRRLNEIIARVKSIVGDNVSFGEQSHRVVSTGAVQMWAEKLGNNGAGKIFKFIAEKSPLKFTRAQLGLAVGFSSKSGSFATYMATLKRNNLIIENGGLSQLNPDL